MLIIYLIIWGFMLLTGMTALWALVWSVEHGLMHSLDEQAASIFNLEEPVADDDASAFSVRGE